MPERGYFGLGEAARLASPASRSGSRQSRSAVPLRSQAPSSPPAKHCCVHRLGGQGGGCLRPTLQVSPTSSALITTDGAQHRDIQAPNHSLSDLSTTEEFLLPPSQQLNTSGPVSQWRRWSPTREGHLQPSRETAATTRHHHPSPPALGDAAASEGESPALPSSSEI